MKGRRGGKGVRRGMLSYCKGDIFDARKGPARPAPFRHAGWDISLGKVGDTRLHIVATSIWVSVTLTDVGTMEEQWGMGVTGHAPSSIPDRTECWRKAPGSTASWCP